ncbi:MAG: diaminopimelate epimerase [Pseudomonadota bacterium]
MTVDSTGGLPFMKMHGLGNDFVIVDARAFDPAMTDALAKGIGHRRFGVGFDQLALLSHRNAQPHLTFYNSDGSHSSACGNATRCIARFLMDESGAQEIHLGTDHGTLTARDAGAGETSVNMGQPQVHWKEIPLAQEMDTLYLPLEGTPTATGMGNPHCTFFVETVDDVDLTELGPAIEHHPLFPQRTNVQVARIVGEDHIRMRVWERGVGITLASGSSSCATCVAAVRRGLTGRRVQIDLDGGPLAVDWREDGVWMTGPTAHVFDGVLTRSFLESVT